MGKGQRLYLQAKKIIPGGTQLLSKRPEMFLPDFWPAYYSRAKGCLVRDLDGHNYVDMSYMGIGSCILGYADKDINSAVCSAVRRANMATLNCPQEVELAKLLIKLHPWAEMARFARSGGEAMAVAARIARASAGKDMVLFCGYHGWHDWYLCANLGNSRSLDGHLLNGLNPLGVARKLKGTALPFKYNDTKGFLDLALKYKGRIGAVVMEPVRGSYPQKGFLETVREVTRKQGIVLVFDEITSGWRLAVGGAHLVFRIAPDIAVFAKGMSNGFPMAAIIGRKDVMRSAEDTFISSTYWTESIGPAAALATIKKLKEYNVPRHLAEAGKKVKSGWMESAEKYGLKIAVSGIDPLGHFDFQPGASGKGPLILKTLFTQLMLDKGFLATTSFYASYAHKDCHLRDYLKAADAAFEFISGAVRKGNPEKYLKGPVCHGGFQRLT